MRFALLVVLTLAAAGGATAMACGGSTPTLASDAGAATDAGGAACPSFRRVPTASGGGRYVTLMNPTDASTQVVDAVSGAPLFTVPRLDPTGVMLSYPFAAAVDARSLVTYDVTSEGAVGFWRVESPLADGGLRAIASGDVYEGPRPVALRDQIAFWIDDATVSTADAAGPTQTALFAEDLGPSGVEDAGPPRTVTTVKGTIDALAVDDATVYASAHDDAGTSSTIWAIPRSGGAAQPFVTGASIRNLQIAGGVVYWTEDVGPPDSPTGSTVRAEPKTGGGARTIAASVTPPIESLAITARSIAWGAAPTFSGVGDPWAVQSVPLAGGAPTTLASGTFAGHTPPPRVFADGGGWFAWGLESDPHVVCE
jgi:hypothetical protein